MILWVMLATVAGAGDIDRKALKRLVKASDTAHSTGLVVLHDGQIVHSSGDPDLRIEAMSATKSVVALAVGVLVGQGKLEIDTPIHTLYPEWKQGMKQQITVRHLLDHSSGIQNAPNTADEIYPSPDFVQLALTAELSDPPGTHFAYNNKAVNLLAGVIERASGTKLDDLLRAELFDPMGIAVDWTRDPAGNPHGMSGLQIRPQDLASIGQLMLQGGKWQGEQLLPEAFLTEMVGRSALVPECGLLWWLNGGMRSIIDEGQIASFRQADVGDEFILTAQSMMGVYDDWATYGAALEQAFGEDWRTVLDETLVPAGLRLSRKELDAPRAWAARGFRGQYLLVVPEHELVAVRMVESTEAYDPATDEMPAFESLVLDLVY